MELDARICDRARRARDPRFDGAFFIAVLSTGIYCRPICPSPTARNENVRYFRSAAEAAAAGFRACLRCRPEAIPGTPRWTGTLTTVRRALRLIEEGALAEEGVSSLARRLGVSARQLHRLFTAHLGASPIAVAKTWRCNFARQLLHDTDLPMSAVALAAGFRTVRRFNDAIRTVYGRTPSEIRRRSSVPPRASRDEHVLHLPYRPPYDWASMLAFLEARAIRGVEDVCAGAYRRTFREGRRNGLIEVAHDERTRSLVACVRGTEPAGLLAIVSRLRALFDLAADPSTLARQFRADPILGPLVAARPGLRVPGAWDPFEIWVRATLGENLSGSAPAAALVAERFGEKLPRRDGTLTTVFPSSEALSEAREHGRLTGRASPLAALGEPAAASLRIAAESDDEAAARLSRAAGLGAAAAGYALWRVSREPDAFPSHDPAILASAPEGARSAAALTALAERWRPWRAYAAVHLWRAAVEGASAPRRKAAG